MLTAVGVLLVVLDQLTKYIIMQNVTYMTEEIPVIDNFFDIVHWHNTGGAWGRCLRIRGCLRLYL